jgi:hypothetical protein
MLNTFIKNQGITKTIIHNNNKNYYNEIDWDADYDGEVAKVSFNINDNGIKEHYNAKMNNDELTEILNIPSISAPIDKRLYNDFLGKKPKQMNEPKMVLIYKKPKNTRKHVTFIDSMDSVNSIDPSKIMDTLELTKPLQEEKYTHISSPFAGESLIYPLQLQNKKNHSRRRRRNKRSHSLSRKTSKPTSSNNTRHHSRKSHKYSRRTF